MAVNICELAEEPLLEDLLAFICLPDFRTRDWTGSGFFFNPDSWLVSEGRPDGLLSTE
jgi:hypothetical protein